MNSYIGKQIDSSTYLKECRWHKLMKCDNCQSYGYIEVSQNVKVQTRFDVQNMSGASINISHWSMKYSLNQQIACFLLIICFSWRSSYRCKTWKTNGYFIASQSFCSISFHGLIGKSCNKKL